MRLAVFSLLALLLSGVLAVEHGFAYNPKERDLVNNELPAELEGIGITEKLSTTLPLDLKFTNEKGEKVALNQFFHGDRPVILSLVYYTCPSLCNIHLNGLMDGIRELKYRPGEDFELVFVSFEPKDTLEVVRDKKPMYLKEYGLEPYEDGVHFLLSDDDEVKKLAEAVGFSYKWDDSSDQWAHASAAVFLSPQGKITRYLHGVVFDQRNLRLAVTEAAAGKVGDIIDKIVLFCFHYDPVGNQYSVAAFRVMQVGGVAMIGLMALWLIPFWLRRQKKEVEGVK